MARYKAFMTASSVEWPDVTEEDREPIEHHGWIDQQWSRTELFESRNDVHPVAEIDDVEIGCGEDSEFATVDQWVASVVKDELGHAENNGDGTYYATDATIDWNTCKGWSYALHFHAKLRVNGVWTEVEVS